MGHNPIGSTKMIRYVQQKVHQLNVSLFYKSFHVEGRTHRPKKGSRPNLKSVCTLLQRLATLPLPTTVANIKTYGTNEFQVGQNETKTQRNETNKQTKQNKTKTNNG